MSINVRRETFGEAQMSINVHSLDMGFGVIGRYLGNCQQPASPALRFAGPPSPSWAMERVWEIHANETLALGLLTVAGYWPIGGG